MPRATTLRLCLSVGLVCGVSTEFSTAGQTFRADTLSIEIDARVLDKRHEFVRDLKPSEFVLRDDGKEQIITTFALVELPRDSWSGSSSQPAGERAITPAAPPTGRLYAIVIDDVHLDPRQSRITASAAKRFVDGFLAANDGAALICTGGMSAPNVTNNRDALKAAVDTCIGQGNAAIGAGTSTNHEEQVHAAVATMHRLGEIATALGRVPGRRKAIVFLSQGIDLDYTQLQKYPDGLEGIEATQEAVAMATRSNVTIYGIDPRGPLPTNDNSVEVGSLPRGPQAAMAMLAEQREAFRRSQDNLRALSDQTGGFATVNQHDFGKAFARIVDENSSYYLIGFTAAPERRDGRPHRIEVNVTRRGMDVQGNRAYVLAPAR